MSASLAKEAAIPLVDLKAQHDSLRTEIDRAIASVIDASAFIQGADVRAFEREFASFCGVAEAAGVGSGTAGLELALSALGIGAGDEVITTPFTFIATVEAITRVGAKPVFADVEETSLNLNPELAERAVTAKTRAIIPVHLYGRLADMKAFVDLAARKNLKLIEDASQAHGASLEGRKAGSWGDAAVFSFYPGKNLGALGDAGIVVSKESGLAARVRRLADHGRNEKYLHEEEGFNHRLDTLQAAVLRVKLRRLGDWNKRRRHIAALYSRALADQGLILPAEPRESESAYHLYVVRHARREMIREKLSAERVSTGVHYPVPLHLQPAYKKLNLAKGSFPAAEKAAETVFSLPMYPELTDAQVERVIEAVKKALI